MNIQEVIGFIDQALLHLHAAKTQLRKEEPHQGPGRPRGTANKLKKEAATAKTGRKRTMSADGRARIAEAQKTRWAAYKKAAKKAARTTTKKASTTL